MEKALSRVKIVTERDRLLMRWIGTNGVASLKQLQTVFWPEATERTCRERLVLIEKGGLIETHYVETSRKRGEQVFTLTNRAATEYFEAVIRKRLIVGLPPRAELKQQLMAQDTRIVLDQLLALYGKRITKWQNERELRREAAFIKWKPGSPAGRGKFNDVAVADARILLGEAEANAGCAGRSGGASNSSQPQHAEIRLAYSLGQGQASANSPQLYSVSNLLLNLDNFQSLNIEIDGEYFGQMLKTKIHQINRGNQPTLWVTTPKRAARIEEEISQVGPSSIWLMVVEPFL